MKELKKFHKGSILKPIVKYIWDDPVKKINKKQINLQVITILLIIGVILNLFIAFQQAKIRETNQKQYNHINFIYQILLENNMIKVNE